jgi:hypothetical protein
MVKSAIHRIPASFGVNALGVLIHFDVSGQPAESRRNMFR